MATDHAQVGKAIKAELKKHGIKASVRGKIFSGGDSVDVSIDAIQGDRVLCPATIAKVEAFAKSFQMGHFNGMEDIYEYSNRGEGPQVKFVFVTVNYGELRDMAAAHIDNLFEDGDEARIEGTFRRDTLISSLLTKGDFNFYRQFKARQKAVA